MPEEANVFYNPKAWVYEEHVLRVASGHLRRNLFPNDLDTDAKAAYVVPGTKRCQKYDIPT